VRAGRLDRLITIQRRTDTPSDSGEPVPTWSNIVARRPASFMPVRGDERFSGEGYVATDQVEFRVRYSSEIATLNPKDRILYPAPDVGEEDDAATRAVYNVIEVRELGRRAGLQIFAYRMPDVT
jgi:head-tail adaptor